MLIIWILYNYYNSLQVMNSPKDYLTFDTKAQLVKHYIVITEGSNPVQDSKISSLTSGQLLLYKQCLQWSCLSIILKYLMFIKCNKSLSCSNVPTPHRFIIWSRNDMQVITQKLCQLNRTGNLKRKAIMILILKWLLLNQS